MNLLGRLEAELERTESVFQQHLLREDIARIDKLIVLAMQCDTEAEFLKQGFGVGWTSGDLQTFRIKDSLDEFLAVFYRATNSEGDRNDSELEAAWKKFNRDRMDRIVGCL